MTPWIIGSDGVVLAVRLTPKGGRDAIDGVARMADGQALLKVRVSAAPSEGEANAALVKLLARTLGVPARDVTLISGASSRLKRLKIAGDGQALADALNRIVGVPA